MARRRLKWTTKQLDKLNKIQEVLEELEKYKPLTLRQVYYQLVGKGYIENKVSQYTMLSNLLKWARTDGHIPWEDIEDRIRTYHDLTGWEDSEEFIQASLEGFLKGYSRDLLQSQDKYIEIWIEKDALSSVFTKVAAPYTVPVVVCRGFSSATFLNDYRRRLRYHSSSGKRPVMLYFGDFDPSGMEIFEAIKTGLGELGVWSVEFKRIALLREDIDKYKLPDSPNALKKTDTRALKHIEAYGELAVELDALRPDILEDKIRSAIDAELDAEIFNNEMEIYEAELDKLNQVKKEVIESLS